MADEKLFEKLCEYFRGRPELVDSVPFHTFSRAKEASFVFFSQMVGWEIEDFPKAAPITLETMIGCAETKKKELDSIEAPAKECASKLYRFGVDDIEINGIYLMTDGSSLPVRVDLSIRNGDDNRISRTMYMKPFDPMRILGIELYKLTGGIEQDYEFFFNGGIVVEDNIEGRHEFDINEDLKSNEVYVRSRVREDLVSFFIGLDDLAKTDNYVVAPNGKIKVIDFDTMDMQYSEEQKAQIMAFTAQELGITPEEYKRIFDEEKRNLRLRVMEHRDRIYRICEIFESSDDEVITGIGKYIRQNTDKLLEEH